MRNVRSYILWCIFLSILSFHSCKQETVVKESQPTISTKPLTIPDAKAEELVALMEEKMGGREAWDSLSYVSWTFFGSRHLLWDKSTMRVRIESPRDSMIYLVDLTNDQGKISKGGREITDPEEVENFIKRGKSIWINDSYWLFMPFKLRDPGVTVSYVGEDTLMEGRPCDVLALTFEEVGDTPNNKYKIYLDREDNLIKKWAFFKDREQDEPSREWPWDNYQNLDGLLLSFDRSDNAGPSNVRIYDKVDDRVFTSFDSFEYY